MQDLLTEFSATLSEALKQVGAEMPDLMKAAAAAAVESALRASKHGSRGFLPADKLTPRQLAGARESIAPGEVDITALLDLSLTHSGKKGYAIASDRLYMTDAPGGSITLSEIISVARKGSRELTVTFLDGTRLIADFGKAADAVYDLLQEVAKAAFFDKPLENHYGFTGEKAILFRERLRLYCMMQPGFTDGRKMSARDRKMLERTYPLLDPDTVVAYRTVKEGSVVFTPTRYMCHFPDLDDNQPLEHVVFIRHNCGEKVIEGRNGKKSTVFGISSLYRGPIEHIFEGIAETVRDLSGYSRPMEVLTPEKAAAARKNLEVICWIEENRQQYRNPYENEPHDKLLARARKLESQGRYDEVAGIYYHLGFRTPPPQSYYYYMRAMFFLPHDLYILSRMYYFYMSHELYKNDGQHWSEWDFRTYRVTEATTDAYVTFRAIMHGNISDDPQETARLRQNTLNLLNDSIWEMAVRYGDTPVPKEFLL